MGAITSATPDVIPLWKPGRAVGAVEDQRTAEMTG